MIKSRTAQLIYQSFFCALGVVAFFGLIGFYNMNVTGDFFIYFTNLSNYLCIGVMLAELVQTAKKKADSYVAAVPHLHFISMLGIVLTFAVFNILLAHAPGRDPALNFKIECILCHLVLPLMFVADWLLFYEHGTVNWKWPLISVLLPVGYLGFIYLHAALMHFDTSILTYAGTDPLIYPYFFLNPEKVGIGGIVRWSLLLLAAFVAMGFLFLLVDKCIAAWQARSGEVRH